MRKFFWPVTEAPFTTGTDAHDSKVITLGIKFRNQKGIKLCFPAYQLLALLTTFMPSVMWLTF